MSRIEDFGEKIGGAKKDLWRQRGFLISDLDDIDEREYLDYITKENVWPTPDYEEYVANGMEPICAYFMKVIRDKLQAKTEVYGDSRDKERAAKYIQFVQDVRDSCEQIKTRDDIKKFTQILLVGHGYKNDTNSWTEKSRSVPGLDNNFLRFAVFSDRDIEKLSHETEIQNFPYEFRGDLKGVYIKKAYWDKKYYIMKGDKELVSESFDSFEEAMEFAKTDLRDILDAKKNAKKRESKTVKIVRPQLERIQRTGPELRNGHNASGDHLLQIFKFRGGEFGNWNTQEDRQAYLNYTFDAFVDLAYVLQCPLEFISFYPHGSYNNQTLAIAFGARGSGFAVAHYEPSRVVINLTKLRGAGSLAHEWGHALDDFLGSRCGVQGVSKFLSGESRIINTQYQHIADAMKKVMRTIQYKDEPAEETLKGYEAEIERYLNKILRSWINGELMYFNIDNGGRRRKPTDEEWEKIQLLRDELCKTGDRRKYNEFVQLYKDIKGIIPSKDMRDACEMILQRVEHMREEIRIYKETGKFRYARSVTTNYYDAAKKLDRHRAKPYYSQATELFARAFESYVEDKLGFKSQYLVHSTRRNSVYGDYKPYPEGEERKAINKAIEELIKLTVQTFSDTSKIYHFNMYKNFDNTIDRYAIEYKPRTISREQIKKQIEKQKREGWVRTALVEVYAGIMERVEGARANNILGSIQSILSSLGRCQYKGHSAKYKNSEDGEVKFTCLIYEGLLTLPNRVSYIQLKNSIRNKVINEANADDCVVRIISPELREIERLTDKDLMKYTKAIATMPIQTENKIVKEEKQKRDSLDNITDNQTLREFLVRKAHDWMPSPLTNSYELLYNNIAKLCQTHLQLGTVVEGNVPIKYAQGHSKGWMVVNGILTIRQKETIEKKLESLLEPMIKILIIRKYKNSQLNIEMLSSMVTYMVCKRLYLDVRTYCLTKEYDQLVKNKQLLKTYIDACREAYDNIISTVIFR
jgi:hypothetical protein